MHAGDQCSGVTCRTECQLEVTAGDHAGDGENRPGLLSTRGDGVLVTWQSMKLTSVACIGSQHTTGSRCGTDQGSIVETRHTTELKVVAPGLLEKIQLCEVRNNNVFK